MYKSISLYFHVKAHQFYVEATMFVLKLLSLMALYRDSIIPVNTMTDDEPEYKNLEYAPDGTLLETADPPPPSQPHSTSKEGGASGAGGASDGVKKLPPEVLKARKEMLANLIKTHNYENTELDRGEGNVP